MACLDTDFLVAYIRKDAAAVSKLKELENRSESLHTTIINAFELYKGAFGAKDSYEEIMKVNRLLDNLFILIMDRGSAMAAGGIHNKIKSTPIGESDLLIASMVLTGKQTLITRNTKHFEKVPELKIESW